MKVVRAYIDGLIGEGLQPFCTNVDDPVLILQWTFDEQEP